MPSAFVTVLTFLSAIDCLHSCPHNKVEGGGALDANFLRPDPHPLFGQAPTPRTGLQGRDPLETQGMKSRIVSGWPWIAVEPHRTIASQGYPRG